MLTFFDVLPGICHIIYHLVYDEHPLIPLMDPGLITEPRPCSNPYRVCYLTYAEILPVIMVPSSLR